MAVYPPRKIRARRWHYRGDVRGYVPPRGWTAALAATQTAPPVARSICPPIMMSPAQK
jgi:hypothetical protein